MTLISRLVFSTKKKTPKKSSEKVKTNEISIVIPVKDNQRGVNNYLDYFFASHQFQNFPREIIIIDNNSLVPIKIKTEHLTKGLTVKLISCAKNGPAAARNAGVTNSEGKWILFNDSDCLPTYSLLSGYQEADNNSVAYAGNIKALGKDRLSRYYETQEILIPLKTRNGKNEFIPQYLITANSLVWKEAFHEVGGFNEDIVIAGGEDVDLGLRLSEIGDLSYAFESVALHNFDDGLIGFCNRFKRYGQGNRIIEELWGTNMKPEIFRPNKRTFFNEIAAKIQYYNLLVGYTRAKHRIRKVRG